jgi:hypothetical protein
MNCTTPPAPVAPLPTTVDVVQFIVGAADFWPRTGDQLQHQVVAGPQVCWVKYGRADMFECWRWDDEWIYHVVDYALDGETGESYSFTDGRWLPRHLTLGQRWTLDVADNRIRWRNRRCEFIPAREGIPDDSGVNLFPYHVEAWIEPQTEIGGDLGVRDVLMLTYASYPPGGQPGEPERFSFAKGAGWYRWSSPRGTRAWTRLGGAAVFPAYPCPWR